ncbi:MAG TPA: hypothetical protein VF453_14385 [Burkholderiaceae bacterium]
MNNSSDKQGKIVVRKRKLDKEIIARAPSLERIAQTLSTEKQEQKMKEPKPDIEEFDEWEGDLKSEVQHLTSGKVLRWKKEASTGNSGLKSAC